MIKFLYHGSKILGLKKIEPRESGHGKELVYATSDPVFAAIFINRPGGSLVQAWGRDAETGIIVLIERKEYIIDINYAGQRGSLYQVSKEGFYHAEGMSNEEWAHEGAVDIVKEINIPDVKNYLLQQAAEGKLKIIDYRDRQSHPEGTDEALIESAIALIKKYGEREVEQIRKYQPAILDEVLRRCKQ